MDGRLQELYNKMDFYASEEPTAEREQKLKEIAHEIVTILTPNKKQNEQAKSRAVWSSISWEKPMI